MNRKSIITGIVAVVCITILTLLVNSVHEAIGTMLVSALYICGLIIFGSLYGDAANEIKAIRIIERLFSFAAIICCSCGLLGTINRTIILPISPAANDVIYNIACFLGVITALLMLLTFVVAVIVIIVHWYKYYRK